MTERLNLTFLHGFTQTHRHWHDTATKLAAIIAANTGSVPALTFVDMPGHGLSAEAATSFEEAVTELCALAPAGVWVGYSMGGRHSLAAALRDDSPITGLVLVGTSPGIADPTQRAARARSDHTLARQVLEDGVATFIDRWLNHPLFTHLDAHTAGKTARLTNSATGLASSLAGAGVGMQTSYWDDLPRLDLPVLLVVGTHDPKFRNIAEQMSTRLPQATLAEVGNAGHPVHSEQPDHVATVIADWLVAQRLVPSPTANTMPYTS